MSAKGKVGALKRRVPLTLVDADIQRTQLMTVMDHTCDGTDEDSVTSVAAVANSYLVGIQATVQMTMGAAGDRYVLEVSRSGNNQANAGGHDHSDTIAIFSEKVNGTWAQGLTTVGQPFSLFGLKLYFRKGDRVFLNVAGENTRHIWIWVNLFWVDADDAVLNMENVQ